MTAWMALTSQPVAVDHGNFEPGLTRCFAASWPRGEVLSEASRGVTVQSETCPPGELSNAFVAGVVGLMREHLWQLPNVAPGRDKRHPGQDQDDHRLPDIGSSIPYNMSGCAAARLLSSMGINNLMPSDGAGAASVAGFILAQPTSAARLKLGQRRNV
ncbi:hypothetical protein X797_007908 [Metarhizium robertsii]|uniref:Uncharacterized protein n=1 Tax=Metarhizium robertsii TaxID=568076 RepID=A0A0A1URQ1_9HYPO|nr:hypothetical protein X797_007908 [Metarhizium robertsii]